MFQNLEDFDFNNKRVIVRCDFNVPMVGDEILDDFRIRQALPTIRYLKGKKARVILISHLEGEDKTMSKEEKRNVARSHGSLMPVALRISELLQEKVVYSNKIVGFGAEKKAKSLPFGGILLLGNLRQKKGEEQNNAKFALKLARLGEVYVNEAFSVCHRQHASIVALPKLLPCFAGIGLEKEISALQKILNPQRPLVVIIGGAKAGSKIKMVGNFLQKADHVLLGGGIVNTMFRVGGLCPGKIWPGKEVVDEIKKINFSDHRLHFPIDGLISPDKTGKIYIRSGGPGSVRSGEEFFDIGDETLEVFKEIVHNSRTLFWAGSLGLVENEKFAKGTEELAKEIIKQKNIFSVVGGGDTVAFLGRKGLLSGFSYVSSGGGAMLSFLSGERMPGIEALLQG